MWMVLSIRQKTHLLRSSGHSAGINGHLHETCLTIMKEREMSDAEVVPNTRICGRNKLLDRRLLVDYKIH